MNKETIGQKIKRIRESRQLTQIELAALAKMSTTTVSQLERGILKEPRLATLQKIATVLNATFEVHPNG